MSSIIMNENQIISSLEKLQSEGSERNVDLTLEQGINFISSTMREVDYNSLALDLSIKEFIDDIVLKSL